MNCRAHNDIKIIEAGTNHVDFSGALEELNAAFGITVVRVDSGGTLNRVLLRAGLVDELHLLTRLRRDVEAKLRRGFSYSF